MISFSNWFKNKKVNFLSNGLNVTNLVLLTPLIYIPSFQAQSVRYRLYANILIGVLGFVIYGIGMTDKNTAKTRRLFIILTSTILLSIVITWAALMTQNKNVYYSGLEPDYLGLITWIVFLSLGYVFSTPKSTFLTTNFSLFIGAVLLTISLIIGKLNLVRGYGVGGLLYAESSLAFFSLIILFGSLFKLKTNKNYWYPIALATIGVLVSQSLIGFLILNVVLGLSIYLFSGNTYKVRLAVLLIAVLPLPVLAPNYFKLMTSQSIAKSFSYSKDLTVQTIHNFRPIQIIRGSGPATLRTDINNQNFRAPDMVKSQNQITRAWGNHNLFHDVYIYFGLLSFLALAGINILALQRLIKARKEDESVKYVYLLLLIFSLLFPPNLFISGLYFITLFKLSRYKYTDEKAIKIKYKRVLLISLLILLSVISTLIISSTSRNRVISKSQVTNHQVDKEIAAIFEQKLKPVLQESLSPRGSALLLDANTGKILSMQDSVEQKNCIKTLACENTDKNQNLTAWEPGSVVKALLVASALEEGRVKLTDKFDDPAFVKANSLTIYDAKSHLEEDISIQELLNLSRNTGAVYVYQKLGANRQQLWHDYLTNHYQFGKPTGADSAEDPGFVRPPYSLVEADKYNILSSFGISLTVTPIQLAAAYASLINGGYYYAPHFDETSNSPAQKVLSSYTSQQMVESLGEVFKSNLPGTKYTSYQLGAKSGTVPAYEEDGTYAIGQDNGVYCGYIFHGEKKYILLVRVNEPKTYEFASYAARDVWTDIVDALIKVNKI